MNAISTEELTKKWGAKCAVNNLGLSIPKGTIYGLLGPNGAGKTTTLSMIAGTVYPSSGKICFFCKETFDKKEVGILLQDIALYQNMSCEANLTYFGKLLKMKKEDIEKRILSLSESLGFLKFLRKKARHLSHGEAKRVMIAQAFLSDPKIVILDEPLSGFDPKMVVRVREFLSSFKGKKTIVISSHNLDEIDKICTHLGIINEGKIVVQGDKKKIKGKKSLERVFLTKTE